MAKGAQAKQEVIKLILDAFGDRAFLYNDGKEIRINWTEAGELCQIKVALTAAKVAVEQGGDTMLPGIPASSATAATATVVHSEPTASASQEVPAPTAEEKQNIAALLAKLGL